jgi:hypothetical protein
VRETVAAADSSVTPDELEAAVVGGDTDRVMALLAGATEAERLACGGRMLRLRKALGNWQFNTAIVPGNVASLLALLGTGTAAQIAAGRRMWQHDVALKVLRLRSPELLAELVPWLLDRYGGWRFVRELVRDGTIPRPPGDAYIVAMLDGFTDPVALLRDDPDLLDHEVWRVFEVEGTGDHSLADHDKYTADAKTWSRALVDLAGTRLDRDRLLDASLAALERDFPAFRAGWYSRFHEALAPTPAERAARVDAYLRLLRSPIAPTVTFAVDALTEVQRAGGLDGGRLLAHIEPAMTARAAGTARGALRLVERAVREDPSLAPAARHPTATALAHGSADVQKAAISLLEGLPGPMGDEAAALLAERRADVAASVRPRLEALLGGQMPPQGAEAPSGGSREGRGPSVATPHVVDRSDPFDALVPLVPVGSLEELVELLAGVLEREGPPESLELALDGVLRLGGERPADFVRVTRAVRVRSERLLAARREQGIATWFASLVRSWVDGTPPVEPTPGRGSLADWLAGRVRDVAREAATGRSRRLAALPSYAGGWIEATDLIARLAELQGVALPPPGHLERDVAQALLRVLPVRREAALADAQALTGEIGDAVRHALGGVALIGPTASLWASAARCRTPDGDDAEVARVHPGLGPDGALGGRYTMRIGKGLYMHRPELDGGMAPSAPRDDVPTDLLWRVSAYAGGAGREGPLVDWMRLTWPQDRRSWFAVSAALLLGNLDWWEARWHDRQRLEALFEPSTPLGPEAAMLVAVGIQAKEPGQRGLTVDAVGEGVHHGRLSAELVVAAFDAVARGLEDQPASKYPITLFRPGRLAQSLDEVARRSDEHRSWVLAVAAGALARMQATKRPVPVPIGQVTPLIRLLVELTAALRARVPVAAEPALRELSAGGGEGARLARALLAAAEPAAAP